jgi:hypothetical protein
MASGSILNFASLVKISRKENEGAKKQSLALLSFAFGCISARTLGEINLFFLFIPN